MAFQNRVTPWGEIIATPERGMFMGNRGCLHNGEKHVIKEWARLPWVTCLLEFKGRHRDVMAHGQYTELFFMDEATALAAGHRPCATCRRDNFKTFKAYWMAANPALADNTGSVMTKIDKELHSERVESDRQKRTWSCTLGELPDGAMVADEESRIPLLVWRGHLHAWTLGGYGRHEVLQPRLSVTVLTPPSVVKVLKAGYQPKVHPTAKC